MTRKLPTHGHGLTLDFSRCDFAEDQIFFRHSFSLSLCPLNSVQKKEREGWGMDFNLQKVAYYSSKSKTHTIRIIHTSQPHSQLEHHHPPSPNPNPDPGPNRSLRVRYSVVKSHETYSFGAEHELTPPSTLIRLLNWAMKPQSLPSPTLIIHWILPSPSLRPIIIRATMHRVGEPTFQTFHWPLPLH